MEKLSRILFAVAAILVSPVALMAHPGHGHENPLSPGHFVANPEHFIPLALTVGAALLAVSAYHMYVSRSKQKK
jgi:hypothetical protein